MKQTIAIILLLALGMTVTMALAKGDFDRITISGPGLQGEVEVMDEPTLTALGMTSITGMFTEINAPADPGTGYLLTRSYWDAGDNAYIDFDQVMFYPADDGASAFVQYVGIVNGSSEYDGEWFETSEGAIVAMNAILEQNAAEPTWWASVLDAIDGLAS